MDPSELARIPKTTYTVLDRGIPTTAQAVTMPLGAAYALPHTLAGTDPTISGHWTGRALPARFRRRNLAEIDLTDLALTMRWLVRTEAGYLCGAWLDVATLAFAPITVAVTYRQPAPAERFGYRIEFTGSIALDHRAGGYALGFAGRFGSSGPGAFTVGQL
ncbi:hypothetical protein [Nocardia blacklockiae]|uniref:hypothetical protein n=1 Tax=Nocardia blacklockiae TaxID=480036 RepID=UPI0018958C03|nr:hypothetical protein [Nocardia blacklockiae]MBF6170218.1 hypothetical protein [Nocardia blacklockiae]